MLDTITALFHEALTKSNFSQQEIPVTYTDDPTHGDIASSIALKLASEAKKNPRDVAKTLVEAFPKSLVVESIAIAGPGFINITLAKEYFRQNLEDSIKQKEHFGMTDEGQGKSIMVEFGQPNTHKAFHIGHLRSAIAGLAIVGLCKARGFSVIKANYFGDVGMHVAKCLYGVQQLGIPESFSQYSAHEKMRHLDNCYAYGSEKFSENPAHEEAIRTINKHVYERDNQAITALYDQTRAWSIDHQTEAFATLGVTYDRQFPESEIARDGVAIVQNNPELFTQSQGALIFDGTEQGLTTWVFMTKEHLPTYSAKDLGLAAKKFSEYPNLDLAIVTTSVEQVDYFKVIIHCFETINPKFVGKYRHLAFGWVLRDNKKTSSRLGESIKGMDILDEVRKLAHELMNSEKDYTPEEREEISEAVALAGLKFLILSHEFHKNINYDPEKFMTLSGFSGPYVLYAYARSKAILRQYAGDISQKPLLESISVEEKSLLQWLIRYPDLLQESAKNFAPHMLCTYLFELAQRFNNFYKHNQVLQADTEAEKQQRIAIVASVAQVLKNGLDVLGIKTVEKM